MSEAGATPGDVLAASPAVTRTEKEVREAILEHTALVRKLKVRHKNNNVALKRLIMSISISGHQPTVIKEGYQGVGLTEGGVQDSHREGVE